MLHTLKLLLPAIVPSWRFFDAIAPSPRVQYVLLNEEMVPIQPWQEFRPRPKNITFSHMLKRMLWNPEWNESLFLVSCSERLLEFPTKHSEDEILSRIILQLNRDTVDTTSLNGYALQFRLKLIRRQDNLLTEKVVYHSRIERLESLQQNEF